MEYCISGCGDVGRRIVKHLLERGTEACAIHALVNSRESEVKVKSNGVACQRLDLDSEKGIEDSVLTMTDRHCIYLVPPQKSGQLDLRSKNLLTMLSALQVRPLSVVLISSTGVYGDARGQWVTEDYPTNPKTDRGLRRLDMERRWQKWANEKGVKLVILRVPGIYAHSRIPWSRLKKGTPVVKPSECGFTNRIHADDLAAICVAACQYSGERVVFNVADGKPGKLSDYLQVAAEISGLPKLEEISLKMAQQNLSEQMLAYLSESRKIDNSLMLRELKVALRYLDFREGLRH